MVRTSLTDFAIARRGCAAKLGWRSVVAAIAIGTIGAQARADVSSQELQERFGKDIHPFLESYCFKCHDEDARKGDLDLSKYSEFEKVTPDFAHWDLVLQRLQDGDMPPSKSKKQPSPELRKSIIDWIQTVREREARAHAGDPGPVLPRRLSNAEYDYTIRDLTGVDIQPTRSFPVDPANQAGFDNSGESLAMSPALVKKYLQAAREVSEHLVLKPDGFEFAPFPAVADTDRDRWAVFRIVNFYRRQPTDYADYFVAAWRYQHRAELGKADETLGDIAASAKVSAKYLKLISETLTGTPEEVGPIARLQAMWNDLPKVSASASASAAPQELLADVRSQCEQMRNYAVHIREEIIPEVKNLTAPSIHPGSQTFVLWKDRQMAANRRRFDPGALRLADAEPENAVHHTNGEKEEKSNKAAAEASKPNNPPKTSATNSASQTPRRKRHIQAPTPKVVQKGGISLPPALVTTSSSATTQMAGWKRRNSDPDLIIPDEADRAEYEAAFARFANIFPDAFYITERARVYLDAKEEQANAGRLLSAGLHSMTGYFRDDGPLYDLILDKAGQKELDRLWDEFDFVCSVPQRMHTSMLWFERTDSAYLRDPVFDPYRPEDKSVTTQEKIHAVAALYLEKAIRNNASETAQAAIKEHFQIVATKIKHVEEERHAAEAGHLKALEEFARRAYRRPLSDAEKKGLHEFYTASREESGGDHEEAMRDCIMRVLMSPNFLFRMDLLESAGGRVAQNASGTAGASAAVSPLSDNALANRLSYFLWASMPDEELLARAAAGDLHRPEVLRAQVRRMLSDPRVRNFATEFAGNWLDFRRFEQHNSVDRGRFPEFDNDLREAMFQEPIRFFVDVVQKDRPVLDFLYAKDTFVNGPLGRFYGVAAAPTGTNDWVHVENAAEVGRGGILPMAVFLTVNSPGLRTSPVKRGHWVVKQLLGERIPPPPPTVPQLPADEKKLGDLTLREALAKHRDNPACASCHARFDSFGLIFEAYGPVGERREHDFAGHRVDVHAEFPGGGQGDGVPGLMHYIQAHRQKDFVDNLCRKMLAYALGRTLILSDDPLITDMRAKLASDGYRFSSLIESIATSPQFLNKRASRDLAKN